MAPAAPLAPLEASKLYCQRRPVFSLSDIYVVSVKIWFMCQSSSMGSKKTDNSERIYIVTQSAPPHWLTADLPS